jgi:hypothetical protein
LIVVGLDDRYLVEVHDSGREPPRLRQAVADDESGRGYLLVTTLSDAHGAYPRPTGKVVWFEFVAWHG